MFQVVIVVYLELSNIKHFVEVNKKHWLSKHTASGLVEVIGDVRNCSSATTGNKSLACLKTLSIRGYYRNGDFNNSSTFQVLRNIFNV